MRIAALVRRSPPRSQLGLGVRSWRATTAIRVFTLALTTGMVASDGTVGEAAPLLATLAVIAAFTSALEWSTVTRPTPWIPIGESALVAVLLMSAPSQPGLLPYLAVPGVIAGVRHGWVTTSNASLTALAAVLITLRLNTGADVSERMSASAPWLLMGFGIGLLASWQSRAIRTLDSRQAPYAAAHQLMERIHQLALAGNVGLNSASLATDLDTAMRSVTGCARTTIFVVDPDDTFRPLNPGEDVERMALELHLPRAERTPGSAVVPLRGAQRTLGFCVLVGVPRWTHELDERAQEAADEFAVRLDTAVLFDDVRTLAASEERNRIAREMHDGVAQEIVGLGYLVDEIESISDQAQTRELASTLRSEITRLVSEIRFSIFDLRHEATDGRLAASLADYSRQIGHITGLRVHLSLSESGPPLPARVATEVLRVAQEAIGNVRKHAKARNLWVSLDADGSILRLEVADDGVGNAEPRELHWGLQGMRERADSVGAALVIAPRPDGGTIVTLQSPAHASIEREIAHEHHRATG